MQTTVLESGRTPRGAVRVRRGFTLMSSVFFVSALLVVGISLLSLAATSRRLANRRLHRLRALNLAIAGADEALAQYRSDPAFMTSGETRTYTVPGEDGGTITLAMTTTDGVKQVTSTATVAAWPGDFSRGVRVTLGENGSVPPFTFAISSKRDLSLSGDCRTASWPTAGGGSVHSNGELTLGGGTIQIDGIASAAEDVNTSGASVSGGLHPDSVPLTFPDIDGAFKDQALASGTTTAALTTLNGGSPQTMQGKYEGDVSIGGAGCTIQDNSVVWITGDLAIDGPVRGTGTIVVDGKITAAAGALSSGVNVLFVSTYPRTPSNPTATAPDQDAIALSGGGTAHGWFYAPYARVTLSDGSDVVGGISGMAVAVSDGSVITVPNDSRQMPPAPGSSGRQGWEEL